MKCTTNFHRSYPTIVMFAGLLAIALLPACQNAMSVNEPSDCAHTHWEYEGPSDPAHWATCYSDCGGTAQSPIDIKTATVDNDLADLQMSFKGSPIELVNNGHTVNFQYHNHGTIKYEGEAYSLDQFHFHSLSEHTVNGKHYPMEVHLVHRNASGDKLLVVGVFVKEGQENAFLESFSHHLPADSPGHNTFDEAKKINVKDLYPTNPAYYSYKGSLTTPPCSQIVNWIVMENPVEASADQLHSFEGVLHHNYRPTQDLNGREIHEHI